LAGTDSERAGIDGNVDDGVGLIPSSETDQLHGEVAVAGRQSRIGLDAAAMNSGRLLVFADESVHDP
jgi:hypothetical protein